jgi:hypothetical protein
MTKKSVAQICAVAAVVALPTLSWAGTETQSKSKATAPAPEKLQESAISGDIGLNVVTAYYTRGIVATDSAGKATNHSASFQPYADINFKAFEGDGFLNKAVFSIGVWESYSNPKSFTGAANKASSTHSWYESDFAPAIALTFGKVTLTETYYMYASPNDSFKDFQGLNSKLSYDDSDLLGALALHPSVSYLKELDGKAGYNDKVVSHGDYWEVAVAPGISAGAVALTFPITAGFGSRHFYDKDGFGYVSVGANLAYTLPVSKSYGTWTANIGGTYYNTSKSATGNKQNDDVVGTAGIAVAF